MKERALIMLLRNIDVNSELSNGTTMKIISSTTKILKVQITNGSHIGDYALIPRIELSPSDSFLPYKLEDNFLLNHVLQWQLIRHKVKV